MNQTTIVPATEIPGALPAPQPHAPSGRRSHPPSRHMPSKSTNLIGLLRQPLGELATAAHACTLAMTSPAYLRSLASLLASGSVSGPTW
jgi:hypothetical protein